MELKQYGEKGLKYTREDLEFIPVNRKKLLKIEHGSEDEEVEVFDNDQEKDIAEIRLVHYTEGNLKSFELEKYNADPTVEINTTVVEDEMSIRPPTRKPGVEMEIGDEEMMFTCSKCDDKFVLLSELRHHKLHICGRKYVCSMCGNRFFEEKNRDWHEYKVCEKGLVGMAEKRDEPQFSCKWCNAHFYVENNRDVHENEICREKKSGDEEERKMPENECGFCGEMFFQEEVKDWHVTYDCDNNPNKRRYELPKDEEKKEDKKEKEKDDMDSDKTIELEIEREEKTETEEQKKMCPRCLDIGENVHALMDCEGEEVANAGYKLAFAMRSKTFFEMLEKIDNTEEEWCPVCKEEDCEDPYSCLKQAKFTPVGEENDVVIDVVPKCTKCQKRHPYDVPDECKDA